MSWIEAEERASVCLSLVIGIVNVLWRATPACWCTMGLASWSRVGTKRWVETCNDITSHRPSSSLAHHHQGTKSSQTQQSLKTLETFNFLWQRCIYVGRPVWRILYSLGFGLNDYLKYSYGLQSKMFTHNSPTFSHVYFQFQSISKLSHG